MKKVLIVVASLAAMFVIMLAVMFLVAGNKVCGEVEAFDKTPVDIGSVSDGTYEGSSETALVKVKVKVTVSDGKIEDIKILKHECGKGRPANAIVGVMMDKNDVEVDTVSGATVSSEVIKDAVRNALRSGIS